MKKHYRGHFNGLTICGGCQGIKIDEWGQVNSILLPGELKLTPPSPNSSKNGKETFYSPKLAKPGPQV